MQWVACAERADFISLSRCHCQRPSSVRLRAGEQASKRATGRPGGRASRRTSGLLVRLLACLRGGEPRFVFSRCDMRVLVCILFHSSRSARFFRFQNFSQRCLENPFSRRQLARLHLRRHSSRSLDQPRAAPSAARLPACAACKLAATGSGWQSGGSRARKQQNARAQAALLRPSSPPTWQAGSQPDSQPTSQAATMGPGRAAQQQLQLRYKDGKSARGTV